MKKILSVLLAFSLMAALAACGKKDAPTTGNATVDPSDAPAAASSTPPAIPIDPYADVPEDTHFFYWYDDKNNIIVEQYTGSNSVVRIPAEFDGLPVTEIGGDGTNGVFVGSDSIEVIIIPEGVVKINSYALQDLPNLKTVILPSTLKHIRTGAFENCENLSDIVLPEGLLSMGDGVFDSCYGLTRMEIPDSISANFYNNFTHTSVGFELVFKGVTYTAVPHEDVGVDFPGLKEAIRDAGIKIVI